MFSCEICGQQYAKTMYKKQHLICHHFKEKLLADIKATSSDFVENDQIHNCPLIECQHKSRNTLKTLQHYGIVHNIVDMYIKDYLKTNQPVPPLKSSGQFWTFHGNIIQDHEEQCHICKRVFQTRQGLGKYYICLCYFVNILIKIIFFV